jgi:hypothetical protein
MEWRLVRLKYGQWGLQVNGKIVAEFNDKNRAWQEGVTLYGYRNNLGVINDFMDSLPHATIGGYYD